MFSNKTYDTLKWVSQILLPGLGTLWFTVSSIWGLPFSHEVLGTITAVDLFIGGLLGLSQSSYTGDGTMIIDTSNPDRDIYRMELTNPIEDLSNKESVMFKVQHGHVEG